MKGHHPRIFVVIIVILATVICCSCFLIFSRITEVDTKSSIGEISGIILNFVSVTTTVILGCFVYFQSERINALESTQYEIFIGAESIDGSIEFDNECFPLNRNSSDLDNGIQLFEGLCNNEPSIYAHINMRNTSDKMPVSIVFTTRNSLLITALNITRIQISIDYQDCCARQDLRKDSPVNAMPICKTFSDCSQFVLGLNIHGVNKDLVRLLEVQIYFTVEDQLGRLHPIVTKLNAVKMGENLRLLSSKSTSKHRQNLL